MHFPSFFFQKNTVSLFDVLPPGLVVPVVVPLGHVLELRRVAIVDQQLLPRHDVLDRRHGRDEAEPMVGK